MLHLNPEHMKGLITANKTVADKIRTLNDAGYVRKDIAKFLKKRYQHVNNVLVADQQKAAGKKMVGGNGGAIRDPNVVSTTLSSNGRLLISQDLRKKMGIKPGDKVRLIVDSNGVLQVMSPAAALRKAQDMVRNIIPEGINLVDELIKDRRNEAAKEEAELQKYLGSVDEKLHS